MQPYFSIILPVYNVAGYLDRCMQSILTQAFADYEIILVDDGSTDDSARICDHYAERHENIQVIHKENGGLASARNAGLDAACGRYIWWVDSDDWIEDGALAALYQASHTDGPDVVKFNYYRIEETREAVNSNAPEGWYAGEEQIDALMNKAFYSAGKFSLSACMHTYRREFLASTGKHFVSERLVGSEDYLFNLQVLPRAKAIKVLTSHFYDYEMRDGSLTQRYKKNLPQRYQELYVRLMEEYQQAGTLEKYRERISFFYVWHLMRGTCIPNEYRITAEHSLSEGRRNIRAFMKTECFQSAVRQCDWEKRYRKEKMMLRAMKWKREEWFFYLYVLKPEWKRRVGSKNGNQN